MPQGSESRMFAGSSDAARASHNASTRRNYHAAWRRFQAWADREGLSTMPAAPETVAAYLAWRADESLSPASLRMDRAAIRYHHTEAGQANPADSEGVRRVLRGLTRQAAWDGRTPRQAAALTEEGLAAIRATAQLPRTGPRGSGRAGQHRPPPRSGGHRARICHAGRHASALRGHRGSGGPMSSFVTTGLPASPSAARRVTRRRQAPPCTSGGPRRRICKRSIVPRPRRKPESSVDPERSHGLAASFVRRALDQMLSRPIPLAAHAGPSSRKLRRRPANAWRSAVSHCHITSTLHPSERSSISVRLSRSRFPSSFGCQ